MLNTAGTPLPRIAILGSGPYTVLVSGAGSGASRHESLAVNRWRNDGTRDDYGQWCYLRHVRKGDVWSAAHQPVCADAARYTAELANDRVTFSRRDGNIETTTEIVVIPGASAEARRVTVSNLGDIDAEVELTSYQEVVLATPASDRGHRAFGNLFVQTEWLPESCAVLAMRRPRSARDKPVWCGHTIATEEREDAAVSCETDRARFIGRGRTARNPVAMCNPGDLSGTVGAVLDPVFALRTRLLIRPGESRAATFTTFFAQDRAKAAHLAALYRNARETERVFELSEEELAPELAELGITSPAAAEYQEMAGELLYGVRPAGELTPDDIAARQPGRAELLAMGITGEWPILFAAVDASKQIAELLAIHRYWRMKHIDCDLVVVCGNNGNAGEISETVIAAASVAGDCDILDRPRGIHVRRRDALTSSDVELLRTVARIRLDLGTTRASGSE